MASPNFDQISIDLSVILDDPVAAAATNGKDYDSAVRSYYINEAQKILFGRYHDDYRTIVYGSQPPLNRDDAMLVASQHLKDFIATSQIASSSASLLSIASFTRLLEVFNVVRENGGLVARFVDFTQVSLLYGGHPRFSADVDSNIFFTQNPSGVQVYPDAIGNRSVNFRTSYLQRPDFELTAGGTNDIQWDAIYWPTLKKLALAVSRLDNRDIQGYQSMIAEVFQITEK